jgi:hypothetical protein
MNEHPTQEKWMEFLYEETDHRERRAIEQHLKTCDPCRKRHSDFQQARTSLDKWRVSIPERHRFSTNWAPVVKWAAAAVVLVSTAFATARVSQPDPRQIEARVEQALHQKVAADFESKLEALIATQQEQVEQLARSIATLREEDQKVIFESLRELQTQQALEYRKLRQSLETMAVLTDRSLKDAQRKLVQLASYTATATPENY